MRLVLALALVAGCLPPPAEPPPDPGDGWTGPTGDPLVGCANDAECPGQVCARDRSCYPATAIRTAHVTWTVHGAAASASTCSAMPDLTLRFWGPNGESFGFAPVPCRNGSFFVDRFPTLYDSVELGPESASSGTTAAIDRETGEAIVRLP